MSKRKPEIAQQWKVLNALQLNDIARICEEWTGRGWTVFAILPVPSGEFAIVVSRFVTL